MVEASARPDTSPKPPRWQRTVALLRDRDWPGIGIELLVVTVGVLLAFQVDQWAQDRRQAREERQFLERMWHETAEAIDETQWIMTMHARYRREFIEGFRALDDKTALVKLAKTPNIGCRARVFPGLGFNPTAFQELSASGRLNIISDAQLRAEMRDVVAAQADAESNRQNQQVSGMESNGVIGPYYEAGLDANDNNTCKVDWPRLAQDPAARRSLVRASFGHTLMWKKYAYVRDKLAIAHNHIACYLGKPDCLTKVSLILRSPPRSPYIPPEARDDIERSAELYNVD
jgi:hypothetical protein